MHKPAGLKRQPGANTWIRQLHGRLPVAQTRTMAIRHGNKIYFQILLDPARAELVSVLAKAQGVRPTSWIRSIVYERLAEDCQQIYLDAVDKDARGKKD